MLTLYDTARWPIFMKKTFSLLNKNQRFELLNLLDKDFPNPKSELNFNNPFELLCAVVLSAQATDESVNKVTPELFKIAPDAYAMAKLSFDEVMSVDLLDNRLCISPQARREDRQVVPLGYLLKERV